MLTNSCDLVVEVDCEDFANVIWKEDYKRVAIANSLESTSRELCTANDTQLNVIGVVEFLCTVYSVYEMLHIFCKHHLKYAILGKTNLNILWPNWKSRYSKESEMYSSNYEN